MRVFSTPEGEWIYQPWGVGSAERRVGLRRSDGRVRVGYPTPFGGLDYIGDFTVVEVANRPRRPGEPVYQYQSGRLIKGSLQADGTFVPDEGSTVIAFTAYRYTPDAPRIYNLPGTFVAAPDGSWTFRGYRDGGPYFGLLWLDKYLRIGQFDDRGEFLENGISPVEIINQPRRKDEPVYEYRSDMLIKGVLRDNGEFVPDEGGTVLEFKDYRPGKDAPRIYNLPGSIHFTPKRPAGK